MDTPQHWTLVIVFTTVGIAFAAGFVMFALWAIRAGQFKDVEGVKYRMIEDWNGKDARAQGDEFK